MAQLKLVDFISAEMRRTGAECLLEMAPDLLTGKLEYVVESIYLAMEYQRLAEGNGHKSLCKVCGQPWDLCICAQEPETIKELQGEINRLQNKLYAKVLGDPRVTVGPNEFAGT